MGAHSALQKFPPAGGPLHNNFELLQAVLRTHSGMTLGLILQLDMQKNFEVEGCMGAISAKHRVFQ